jgi:hypothetical protein
MADPDLTLDSIETILLFLSMKYEKDPKSEMPLSYFDLAFPGSFKDSADSTLRAAEAGIGAMYRPLALDERGGMFLTPEEIDGPDITSMNTVILTGNDDPETVMQLTRVRGIAPHMVELAIGYICSDGTYFAGRTWAGWRANKWVEFLRTDSGPKARRAFSPQKIDKVIKTSQSFALSERYWWHVSLGFLGNPRVKLPTDSTGVKNAFALRDVPEGKQRRAALRHWVTDHWRQNRADPDLENYVRQHLRGAVEFNWNGLRCRLEPSRYDLARVRQIQTSDAPAARRVRHG